MYKKRRQENLQRLINEMAEGNQARFAEMLGRNPSYVGQLVRGVGSFGERIARDIEKKCRKPKGWLDSDGTQYEDKPLENPRDKGLCPVLSWVAAGSFHEMQTPDGSGNDAEEWLACPVPHSENTYVLTVRGESMYNPIGRLSFSDGDMIFVDPARRAENRACVIVRRTGEQTATFKQLVVEGEPPYSRQYLKPLNPNWPEPVIELGEGAELCGVVIFKGTAL